MRAYLVRWRLYKVGQPPTSLRTTTNFLTNTMVIMVKMVIMVEMVKVVIIMVIMVEVEIVIMVEMVIMIAMVIIVEIRAGKSGATTDPKKLGSLTMKVHHFHHNKLLQTLNTLCDCL